MVWVGDCGLVVVWDRKHVSRIWDALRTWQPCMHKYTQCRQERRLFWDTQDLALTDGMSQGIKLDVSAPGTQNKDEGLSQVINSKSWFGLRGYLSAQPVN